MKRCLFIWVLLTLFVVPIFAQVLDDVVLVELNQFRQSPEDSQTLYLPMAFDEAEALKSLSNIKPEEIKSITLVYTLFKQNPQFDQEALNAERIETLKTLIPGVEDNKHIRWELVAQTGCNNPDSCKEFFHGFEIKLRTQRDKVIEKIERDWINYYVELFRTGNTKNRFLDSLNAMIPPTTVTRCDTVWVQGRKLKNRRGEFTPKYKRSEKKLARMMRVKFPDISEVTITLDYRNRVVEAEGMDEKEAMALLRLIKIHYSLSTSKWQGERVGTMHHISVSKNSKGKIREIQLSSNVLDAELNPVDYVAVYHELKPKIECSSVDTTISVIAPSDPIVTEVMLRNKQWKNGLVVTDVTGSMSPYIGQFMAWHLIYLKSAGAHKHFVFFNDGNNMPDTDKVSGEVGGTYYIQTSSYSHIQKAVFQAQLQGSGGDAWENDLEAILYGLKKAPFMKEVILIADNSAPPRDMELLASIHVPVHVVLCGDTKIIQTAYLDLARNSGGSIHTMDEDIVHLAKMAEGEVIEIEGTRYILKEGKFVQEHAIGALSSDTEKP